MLQAEILLNTEIDSSGNNFYCLSENKETYYSLVQIQRSLCTEFSLKDLRNWMEDRFCNEAPYTLDCSYDVLKKLFEAGLPRAVSLSSDSTLNEYDFFEHALGTTFVHASIVLQLFNENGARSRRFPKLFQNIINSCEKSILPLETEVRRSSYDALIMKHDDWIEEICKYGGRSEHHQPLNKIRLQILYSAKERQKFSGIPNPHYSRHLPTGEMMVHFQNINEIIERYKKDRPYGMDMLTQSTILSTKLTREKLANISILDGPLAEKDILENQNLFVRENKLPGDITM